MLLLITASLATDLRSDIQAIVDGVAQRNNCSVSFSVLSANLSLDVAGGAVDLAGTPAKSTDKYAWGSVTKTITGAAIMRHVAAGNLSLDDSAEQYIDPVLDDANYPYYMGGLFQADRWAIAPTVQYNASDVTIRHLLNMISGVPDYDTDAYRHLQYSHPTLGFSPLDILDIVHGPLMFKPGGPVPSAGGHHHHGSMNYCSVNFILLGLVLTQLAGAPSWDAYAQSEILPPPLRKTVEFAGLDTLCSATAPVHGFDRQSVFAPFDVSAINCLGGWTAGNVLMSAPDAAAWTLALWGPGEAVLPAAALKQMLPQKNQGYGLAMFNFDQRYANGTLGEAYGHLGDTYGFTSTVTYFTEAAMAMAVATNLEEGQGAPSEVNCLAYNRILDEQMGRNPPRKCVYVSKDYYGGGCQCEK